jgi:4-hydroxy-4-methyl-2-oxoglutarate aldolase
MYFNGVIKMSVSLLCSKLNKIPISTVYDACNSLGVSCAVVHNIKPLNLKAKICGPVYPVRYGDPDFGPDPLYTGKYDYLNSVPVGSIIMTHNDENTDCAMMGEITASICKQKQIQGTIIDGQVRDSKEILEGCDYPIFSRGETCIGTNVSSIIAVNEKMPFANTIVTSSDIVMADRSSILLFDSINLAKILEKSLEIFLEEGKLLESINKN